VSNIPRHSSSDQIHDRACVVVLALCRVVVFVHSIGRVLAVNTYQIRINGVFVGCVEAESASEAEYIARTQYRSDRVVTAFDRVIAILERKRD